MIGFLYGMIEEKTEGLLVLNVSGVGYEICVSNFTLAHLGNIGEDVKIYTYLQVKEDGLALFGFSSQEEKAMFLKLIEVSGVGPKMASSILSGLTAGDLATAIRHEDVQTISKIKGLGKKTAERICLELKDKVEDVLPLLSSNALNDYMIQNTSAIEDATETLISLGVSKGEAYKLARTCSTEVSTAEEIIVKALQSLNR